MNGEETNKPTPGEIERHSRVPQKQKIEEIFEKVEMMSMRGSGLNLNTLILMTIRKKSLLKLLSKMKAMPSSISKKSCKAKSALNLLRSQQAHTSKKQIG